jgi:beta-glucosidase-like glycosyl hydrolase
MVSLATYPHIDPFRRSIFSPLVIDGLPRRDLHSDGVVVSDDHGAAVATASVSRLCAPLCS